MRQIYSFDELAPQAIFDLIPPAPRGWASAADPSTGERSGAAEAMSGLSDEEAGRADIAIHQVILMSPHADWQPCVGSLAIRGEKIIYAGPGPVAARATGRRGSGPALMSMGVGSGPALGSMGTGSSPALTPVGDRPSDRLTAGGCPPARDHFDGQGAILMPGLVNGHCHGDMALIKSEADGLTLAGQNELFAPHNWFGDLLTDDDRFLSRRLTYAESLLAGVTFICENMYWSLGLRSVEAMHDVGITGALAEDLRADFRDCTHLHSKVWLSEFSDACRRYGYVPVAGCCSEEDFEPGRMAAEHRLASSCGMLETRHYSETPWRIDRIRERFGTTPTALLKADGALSPALIASHAVHLTPEDIADMAQAGVKVVNTPLCEMKIADGMAPIVELMKGGVVCGLGTDGAGWNNSNDIFREMKGLALLSSIRLGPSAGPSPKQLLTAATIGGLAVFGEEGRRGSLELGKMADFILVDIHQPHLAPMAGDPASALVFCATGRDVADVFVGGRHVVRDGQLMTLDAAELVSKAEEVGARIRAGHRRLTGCHGADRT